MMLKGPIAIFWILREHASSQCELLTRGFASDISIPGSDHEYVSCTWADIPARSWLTDRGPYRVLWLRIPDGAFLEMVEPDNAHLPLGRDKGLPLAQTFAESALALRADVGVLAVHGHHQDPTWIDDFEWRVQAYEVDDLLDERFGLLYISDEYLPYWTHTPIRDDRDELPVARGRLLFAGRGGSRWF